MEFNRPLTRIIRLSNISYINKVNKIELNRLAVTRAINYKKGDFLKIEKYTDRQSFLSLLPQL